ncbi:MAG TPA: hypothetical protein VHO04_13420 [Sphingopyxis sp.]|uniref:hypothetical protein n=1 Tax=Sphingopyxis sp. TaxID=1908224 RepID=UPI002E332AB7|nr:hypothetical protein [Sphingopyxis sp.]HEX2813670.1 hypothetical protein [Sphingopyxis sp.]
MMAASQRDALFTRLLRSASLRANEILSVPGGAARVEAIADDGYSEIERLARSPLADDQLLAVALRLNASGRGAGQPIIARLAQYFHFPAPSIKVEAMRRSIWSEQESAGLPLAAARREVARVESRMSSTARERYLELRAHASLYSDLWCDPRTGAGVEARRLMLAMVTAFSARSNALRGAARVCEPAL